MQSIIDENGKPWWVAKEICDILGLSNVTKALLELDQQDKMDLTGSKVGRNISKLRAINEAGLYELIFKSRKPEAKAFKRWIKHIVVPEIRRTGGFIHATADMSDDEVLARGYEVSQRKLAALRGQVQDLLPKAEGFDHFIDTDMLVIKQRSARLKIRPDLGQFGAAIGSRLAVDPVV